MDKQKQIEEMVRFIDIHNEAKKIAKLMPSYIVGYDGKPKSQHLYIEQKMEIAKEIIKQGAVVLTREEYEKLKLFEERVRSGVCFTQKEWFDYCQKDSNERTSLLIKAKKDTRKETAEKIANRVHNLFNRDIKDSVVYTQEEKTILKEFVESIDEICKEITEGSR